MIRVNHYIKTHRPQFEDDLTALLRIASVSADSRHKGDIGCAASPSRSALALSPFEKERKSITRLTTSSFFFSARRWAANGGGVANGGGAAPGGAGAAGERFGAPIEAGDGALRGIGIAPP